MWWAVLLCLLSVAGEESHRDERGDGRLCESVFHLSVQQDPQTPRGNGSVPETQLSPSGWWREAQLNCNLSNYISVFESSECWNIQRFVLLSLQPRWHQIYAARFLKVWVVFSYILWIVRYQQHRLEKVSLNCNLKKVEGVQSLYCDSSFYYCLVFILFYIYYSLLSGFHPWLVK